MISCYVSNFDFSYLVVALSNGTIEVYRLEDQDKLISVASNPPVSSPIPGVISNLIWDPINEILMSKYVGKSVLEVWSLTGSGGLSRSNDQIKDQNGSFKEAKVFAIRLSNLFVYNSEKNFEALSINRFE